MKGEKEELQKGESLDDSTLSIKSEVEGQKDVFELLKDDANVSKDFEQIGGFKNIKILRKQDKPEFIQFVNNEETTGKATNDNVFGDEECFYHAVLRTIEKDKSIKFIGKNIQRFAGNNLGVAADDDDVYLCLYLIANLFSQLCNEKKMKSLLNNIAYSVQNMSLLNPNNNETLEEMFAYADKQSKNSKTGEEECQKYLQAICEKLDEIIESFDKDNKKIINKFLCQLFFLIFFTNKIDIKPENILVEKNNNNVKIIHTDVDDYTMCKGMFDTFKNHEKYGWYFNKLFLKTIWKRISSDELSEDFHEYIEKYTLTEEKLKKIISRTVKNVFRSNDDIKTNKVDAINPSSIISLCDKSFQQMKKYMKYMSDTVIKEIELNGGNNEKKKHS
ncbi:MAG: hypothetical protein IJT15_04220 [Rickettsiales bacterium]|nr:hypothetical protein [Rickettsiales bacterium]